jgi:hypothetical protein
MPEVNHWHHSLGSASDIVSHRTIYLTSLSSPPKTFRRTPSSPSTTVRFVRRSGKKEPTRKRERREASELRRKPAVCAGPKIVGGFCKMYMKTTAHVCRFGVLVYFFGGYIVYAAGHWQLEELLSWSSETGRYALGGGGVGALQVLAA